MTDGKAFVKEANMKTLRYFPVDAWRQRDRNRQNLNRNNCSSDLDWNQAPQTASVV
jgi:hypothetical protein